MCARRPILVVLVATACLLLPAIRASAQQGWSGTATDLSSAPGSTPLVAVDGHGSAIASWRAGSVLQAARYTAGSGWSAAVDVADPLGTWLGYDLVMDESGNATALWATTGGIEAARYSAASGIWSPAVLVAPGVGHGVPDLALEASGDALAVWEHDDQVEFARFRAADGTWTAPAPAGLLLGESPRVAVDPAGNAMVVAWSPQASDSPLTLRAIRYVAADGAWGDVTPLTTTILPFPLDVAVDAAGNVIVLAQGAVPGYPAAVDVTRFTEATGTWGRLVNLGYGSGQLAMNADGDAVVAWQSQWGIQASRYTVAVDSWSGAAVIRHDFTWADATRVGIDAAGAATVVWVECITRVCLEPQHTTGTLHATRQPAGSEAWTAAARSPTASSTAAWSTWRWSRRAVWRSCGAA